MHATQCSHADRAMACGAEPPFEGTSSPTGGASVSKSPSRRVLPICSPSRSKGEHGSAAPPPFPLRVNLSPRRPCSLGTEGPPTASRKAFEASIASVASVRRTRRSSVVSTCAPSTAAAAPCARLGGSACAASPSRTTRPLPHAHPLGSETELSMRTLAGGGGDGVEGGDDDDDDGDGDDDDDGGE
eukprot:6208781-Pleurochrysis_carterae.AAC.2